MRKIYEYRENMVWCLVYDFTFTTVKEMESDGWKLSGMYYGFLAFYKEAIQ